MSISTRETTFILMCFSVSNNVKEPKKRGSDFSPDPLFNSIEYHESGLFVFSWISICLFSIEPGIDHGHGNKTCALMGLTYLLFTDCVFHNYSFLSSRFGCNVWESNPVHQGYEPRQDTNLFHLL